MKLKTNEDKINLPVRVLEPVHEGSEVGLKGVNLLNGETVKVFLTTKGKTAENEARPTIAKLFEGIETDNDPLRLQEGSVVSMNSAWRKKKGHYIAQWPQVLKFDGEDTTLLCQYATLIPSERDDGSTTADFYSFHPEQSIKDGATGESLKQAIVENAEQTERPAYLIRAVSGNQVLDYEIHLSVYDREQERALSPEEIAASVTNTAGRILEENPGATLDILPASRFFVPAQNYEKRSKYFTGLQRFFSKDAENGDREYCCRQALVKCGGDNDQYCNQVSVIEPFKPGVDPVLIGGLRHREVQEDAEKEADRQMAACRP